MGTGASIKQHHSHNVFQVQKTAAHSPSAALHGEKSVHTHQHISRAVNKTQDGERETQWESTVDSYSLTATVYILYCSITHVCHTYCLYDYQTLFTYCTHKEVMLCNCLYLKMSYRWPCLYVDVFHKCNKESLACCCPASVFDAVLLLMLKRKCSWSIWSCMSNTFLGVDESEVYFVVSWSLSGAYILLSWIESHMLILSGGGTCHIKPTSFTYQCVQLFYFYTRLTVLMLDLYILAYIR